MSFTDLTAAQAEAYRSRVAADGPIRLAELSRHLTAAGVSLDPFDGTVSSLEPLWRWFTGFARDGFPGIPADARPRTDAVEPQGQEVARAGYAAELVAHYMFEVARSCFRDVAWVSNGYRGMDSFQRAAVQYQDDHGFVGLAHLDMFTVNATLLFLAGEIEFAAPDFLAGRFLIGPFLCGVNTAARCRTLPRGPSILMGPWGEAVDEDIDAFVFASSAAQVEEFDEASDETGGELLFADMAANVEALEDAPPLNISEVVPMLIHLGFVDIDGNQPTKKDILGQDLAEYVRGDDAQLTALVAGGKLRALQVASISPSTEAWNEITEAFLLLAGPMGARLAPEDEF